MSDLSQRCSGSSLLLGKKMLKNLLQNVHIQKFKTQPGMSKLQESI
jgi:hypothetical protein